MKVIRSVLWIGSGKRFAADVVRDAPTLDFVWAPDVASARAIGLDAFDVVVLDAPDADAALSGLRDLGSGPARRPPLLVRLARPGGTRESELRAAGADDVLAHPGERETELLIARLDALSRARSRDDAMPMRDPLAARLARGAPGPDVVGEARPMRHVFALAERAARSDATVLLCGETGTGKEVVARAIHRQGARRCHHFVAVNCAAFPEGLLESELLGHVRGAFTGADRDRKGLFEEACGGTLFLDEVAETSAGFQAKLLRVLQEREVRPVGGSRIRRVDVRVVAATNRDLWGEVQERRFREDLYYRLAIFPIPIPPLRERPGDIEPLARHFLARIGQRTGQRGCSLDPEALRLLEVHPWPGNVRELENEIERALALAEPGERLGPAHFSERVRATLRPIHASPAAARPGESLREAVGRVEAWLIRNALETHSGRRAETARRLGLTREGLYKKMKRFGIE